jgi:alkyl hydroperoxide reductase subunit AhpC
MSLRINSEVPDFTAETTQGTVSFHDWIGDAPPLDLIIPSRARG